MHALHREISDLTKGVSKEKVFMEDFMEEDLQEEPYE